MALTQGLEKRSGLWLNFSLKRYQRIAVKRNGIDW